MQSCCSLVGLTLVVGLYAIIAVHFYAFILVICPLLKSRLGTELGMLWITVGLVLLFNIVFNHFWAMVLKPGSSKDQRAIEQMRKADKKRAYRKPVDD